MGERPSVPGWVRWMLDRTMAPEDARAALSDLEDLYRIRLSRYGVREAKRWYRRQLRQYPLRLLVSRLRGRSAAEMAEGIGAAHSIAAPAVGIRETLRTFGRDVRHGARGLARIPTLSASIILTVGLGIGGCTAVFAVVDALFLEPLPYPEPDRLVRLMTESTSNRYTLSDVDFLAIRDQQTVFESLGSYRRGTRTFTAPKIAERVPVAFVTHGLFSTLGVTPIAGRDFTPDEGRPGSEATALVTAGFASRFLDADGRWPEALDKTIRLDGTPYRVVGVLPQEFGPLLRSTEVFPIRQMDTPRRRGPFGLTVIGRLRADVDAVAASAELAAINQGIYPLWADSYRDQSARWTMIDLPEALNRDVGPMLMMLLGAVGFVLLVAASNATNLLLARVGGRRRELAVRSALGASRGQLIRFLLTESALLALGGVLVGLLVADRIIALLPVVAATYIPRLDEVSFSGSTLMLAVLLALSAGLLFGFLPALHGSGRRLPSDLCSGGRSPSQSRGRQRYHSMLVGAQLVVVVPLLAGAGLLASSFARLQNVDPGFDPENLVTMRMSLSAGAYPDQATRQSFWDEALTRVGSIPGVVSVGLSNYRPPDVNGDNNNNNLEEHPTPPDQSQPAVPWIAANQGYFETLGVPLIAGRLFNQADLDADAPAVAITVLFTCKFYRY